MHKHNLSPIINYKLDIVYHIIFAITTTFFILYSQSAIKSKSENILKNPEKQYNIDCNYEVVLCLKSW